MSFQEPYVGEICMTAFPYPPPGWALCNGDLLPISEYETLYSLIGTTYGGDGHSTFALPDLRSRFPVGQGQFSGGKTFHLGEASGSETVSLSTHHLPSHTHLVACADTPGNQDNPKGNVCAVAPTGTKIYITGGDQQLELTMEENTIGLTGGNGFHENMPPYCVVNFIIALVGEYPPAS